MINRGVALIGITPAFYKALGFYSSARAMVVSLKTLIQRGNYRGVRISPEQIRPHKNFHRFNLKSSVRPSVRKLLASIELHSSAKDSIKHPAVGVPPWNSQASDTQPPPATGPPKSGAEHHIAPRAPSQVGLDALRNLTRRKK
jgi:hypothetical protein